MKILINVLILCMVFLVAEATDEKFVVEGKLAPEQCLNAHIDKRIIHGAPYLHWDESLAKMAKEKLAELKANKYEYVRFVPGENFLKIQSETNNICKTAADKWYVGRETYNYENPVKEDEKTYPFIGMVWREGLKFGCAVSCDEFGTHVMCMYDRPTMNELTESNYKSNVSPPRSK